MNISNSGIELIKSFEGLRLKAYKVLPSEKYYTIGYGHYGVNVTPNMTITEEQAEQLLLQDIKKYEQSVNKCKLGFKPNQNQFDSLVSFSYNLGVNIMKDFIGLSAEQVAKEMLLYVNSGGVRLQGLVNRRKKEVDLFNTPIKNNNVSHETIVKEYRENGYFYPNTLIYFRNKPYVSNDNPIQGNYNIGEYVIYDYVIIGNDHVWISWISRTGIRRYMPIREFKNGKYGEIWGTIK